MFEVQSQIGSAPSAIDSTLGRLFSFRVTLPNAGCVTQGVYFTSGQKLEVTFKTMKNVKNSRFKFVDCFARLRSVLGETDTFTVSHSCPQFQFPIFYNFFIIFICQFSVF